MWSTAASVVDALSHLYGPNAARQMTAAAGVVHVTAVWRASNGLVTLRINADTPRSEWDFFALNATRARADGIITTGAILRDEPEVVHDLQGARGAAGGLAAWRRDTLGKADPPYLLVLTSGRGIPTDAALGAWHPALRAWARPIVYTGSGAARALAGCARDGVEVVASEAACVRAAIAHLQRRGCGTIAIEAGPSTSSALYDSPVAVDEVLFSMYEGATVPPNVRGARFIAPERLQALYAASAPPRAISEPSGRWRFQRMRRRTASHAGA